MVEAHLFMFENLWRHATPAQFRIKEHFYLEGPQVVMQIVRQDKLIRFVIFAPYVILLFILLYCNRQTEFIGFRTLTDPLIVKNELLPKREHISNFVPNNVRYITVL